MVGINKVMSEIIMKGIELNVLYRKGRELILFDFYYEDDGTVGNLAELIDFHFCDGHDFDERLETCAKSIFKNFYFDLEDNEPELIDYEEVR